MSNLFEQMVSVIDEVFWMTDLEKSKMVYISPGYEKIWGYSCQSLYDNPRSFIDAIHPEDRERVIKALMNQPTGYYDETYRIVRADGCIRWIHDRSFPQLLIENEGRLVGLARDITNQKLSESKFYSIIQASPVPMALNDDKFNITFLNQAFIKTFGYTHDEIPTLHDWWPKAYPNEEYRNWIQKTWQDELNRSVLTGENFKPIELDIQCKDGSKKVVLVSASPLLGTINQEHLVLLYDVTEQNLQKKLLKENEVKLNEASKMASLGLMAAGVAHEINNPLTIIMTSSQHLIKNSENTDKLKARLETILKASSRISNIVSSLNKFSRSSVNTAHTPNSLKKIITESIELTLEKSEKNSTPVTYECEFDSSIFCNESEIEQVVINLINNAIDAVSKFEEKWVRLEITQDEQSTILRVIDSGKGISEDIKEKLFNPFFTTKKIGEGTGLGLSITQGILNEHSASISLIANSPNTCFEIKFPKSDFAQ